MTLQMSMGSIKTYDSHDAAERAILCFMLPRGPHGYCYEVEPHRVRACGYQTFYTVKAYDKTGAFAGYCYDPESEQ
jgi:hypothetical protein